MNKRRNVLRTIKRMVFQLWRPLIAATAIEALAVSAIAALGTAPVVLAGDSYPQGGNGDCWRVGTPEMCRTTWTGKGSLIYMRIIDQLNDTPLHNDAGTACSNWNNAPGPQYCSYTAHSNDTWTYLKINNNLIPPNGMTWNCISGACPTSNNAGNILWSEIYVPLGDHDKQTNPCNGVYGYWATQIFAHELGHAYGLAHHGAACSNVALMTQGTTFTGPTSIDIGPFPGCSGAAGTGGVRCIYENT